jgi:hypothetical protein
MKAVTLRYSLEQTDAGRGVLTSGQGRKKPTLHQTLERELYAEMESNGWATILFQIYSSVFVFLRASGVGRYGQ